MIALSLVSAEIGSFTWKMSGRLWRQMVLLWPQTATRGEAQMHNFSETAQPSPLTCFYSLLCLTTDRGGIASDADTEKPHAKNETRLSMTAAAQVPPAPISLCLGCAGAELPGGQWAEEQPWATLIPLRLSAKVLDVYRFLRKGDWGLCISFLLLIAANPWSCLFAVR